MGEGREKNEAFVTLATNDTYALGCLVLGSSLRRVGTTRQLVVMITTGVSDSMRNQLAGLFDHIVPVDVLDSSDTCNLELLGRPDLSVTFTKFHCWRLTQFSKCVFMDADTMVIQNIDELFDREELSAAPDAGWPDCFNSGVYVYVPSEETYRNLLTFAVTAGSFDGGDQGLLNLYFSNWATEDIGKHLPFTYNVVSQAFYSYLPAFKQFYDNIKVVHFIGAVKPWHHAYNTATGTVTPLPDTGHSQEFLQMWWNIFMESIQPNLDPNLYEGGIAGDLAHLSLSAGGGRNVIDDRERKLQWEQGQADYMGVDRFDNIRAKLDEKIASPSSSGTRLDSEKETQPKVSPPAPKVDAGPPPPQPTSPPSSEVPLPSGGDNLVLSPTQDVAPPRGGDVVITSMSLGSDAGVPGETVELSPPVKSSPVPIQIQSKPVPPPQPVPVSPPVVAGDTTETFVISSPIEQVAPPVAAASIQLAPVVEPSPKSQPSPIAPPSAPQPVEQVSSFVLAEPTAVTPPPSKPTPVVLPPSQPTAVAPPPSQPTAVAPPPAKPTPVAPQPAKPTPPPPVAAKPQSPPPTTAKPALTPVTTKPVAPPPATKPSPVSPPPAAPKPVFTPTTQPSPAAPKPAEPKQKPAPFSFKQQETAPPTPAKPQPPTPGATPTSPTKAPPAVSPKPMSPGVAAPKPSFIAGQASRFEKPGPTSPGAAPPKPSPFAAMAARFESPGAAKPSPFGAGAKSPTSPSAPAATGAKSPTGASAPGAPPTGSGSASPAKAATNRDEMLSRYGVKLPPPKK